MCCLQFPHKLLFVCYFLSFLPSIISFFHLSTTDLILLLNGPLRISINILHFNFNYKFGTKSFFYRSRESFMKSFYYLLLKTDHLRKFHAFSRKLKVKVKIFRQPWTQYLQTTSRFSTISLYFK